MKIEHVAFQVEAPDAAAEWYVAHFGMQIARDAGGPTKTYFLADSAGGTMLEIYRNPNAPMPDYPTQHPSVLHVAFLADDVAAETARLVAAGCTVADDVVTIATGDTMAMLRDPWGLCVQIMKRATPIPVGPAL